MSASMNKEVFQRNQKLNYGLRRSSRLNREEKMERVAANESQQETSKKVSNDYIWTNATTTSRKRQKSKIEFEFLCDDIMRLIFLMMNDPRDLYHLTLCNKRLRSILTYEHIIRAAVFHGGHVAKTMTGVIEGLNNTFTPSIYRLLRLVNGKRCERGNMCWGFDLNGNKACTVNIVRPRIGLFICKKCMTGMTTPFQRDVSWALEEDIVARTYSDYTVRGVDYLCTETVTCEPIGPLATMLDLKQITNTFKFGGSNNLSDRKGALIQVSKARRLLDRHLSKADEIINVYFNATRDFEDFKRKRNKEVDAKLMERNARRLNKLKSMHKQLKELLTDHECVEFALDCTWSEAGWWIGCDYTCGIVCDLLDNLTSAPSGATGKRLRAKAAQIKEYFDLLYEKRFFSYSYLGTENSFEKSLGIVAREQLSQKKILSTLSNKSELFMEHIRNDRLSEAFYLALYRQDDVYKEAFARAIGIIHIPGFDQEEFKRLARTVWDTETYERPVRASWVVLTTRAEVIAHWRICDAKYKTLKSAIIDYMTSDETVQFLAQQEPLYIRNGFARLDAVKSVYTRKECFPDLLARNFWSLRHKHRMYFERPEDFNLLPGPI